MGILDLVTGTVRSLRARHRAPVEEVQVAHGTAQVRWSRHRVPTIEAPDELGAWQALGRIHAEERLWQLDLLRKAGRGELARLFGDQPLDWRRTTIHHAGLRLPDLDYFMRVFGLTRAARLALEAQSEQAHSVLSAYVRGLGEGLVRRHGSFEHGLLGVDPEPWSPLDTHVVSKVFAFNLSLSWKNKLAYQSLARQLGPGDALERLLPSGYEAEWPRIASRLQEFEGLDDDARGLLSLDEAVRQFTGGLGAHLGSNSWVVGGSRTRSGRPVLCGDPHLEATAPAPFFLARLRGGALDVAGATIPGVPAVVIGRNRKIAWSITNAMADDVDLFQVPIGRPLGDGVLEHEDETIEVRGGPAQTRRIQRYGNATLLSPALAKDLSCAPGEALALRWTAWARPGRELDAFLTIDRAEDFAAFRRGVAEIQAPAQNFSYADTDGHVGYALGGAFPIRRGGPSLLPRDIDDPAGDWIDWVPPAELPAVLDPPEDLIAHANNDHVSDSPHYFSRFWEPPHRIRRIVERLRPLRDASLDEVAAIQLDVVSLQGRELIERWLRPRYERLLELRPDCEHVLRAILLWDGSCAAESRGAAAFHVFYEHLIRRVAERAMGPAFTCFREVYAENQRPVEELLDEEHPWLEGQTPDQVLARALAAAGEALARTAWSEGWSAWRWGDLHRGSFRHPLANLPGIGNLFRVGPFPAPGSSWTIWNGHYSHVDPYQLVVTPALRFVADLSREESSACSAVLGTGQAGDPFSPHYRDMLPLWLRGERVEFE